MKAEKPIQLLLVDDEASFREAASNALRRRGFTVTPAASGEEALSLIAAGLPDVVVLDLRMEGMDGLTTLRAMRERSPGLPVIILTGHGRLDDAMSGIKLEIVDFLQKPIDLDVLAARVLRLLTTGRSRPLREKSVSELMRPLEHYQRVFADQSVAEAIELLRAFYRPEAGYPLNQPGHRSLLVYERDGSFRGLLRVEDIIRQAVPGYLDRSPYASFFTGMFLAQCKLIGQRRVGELLHEQQAIPDGAPLLEAVQMMLEQRAVHLPVLRGSQPVGVLRDLDLFLEIAAQVSGEHAEPGA